MAAADLYSTMNIFLVVNFIAYSVFLGCSCLTTIAAVVMHLTITALNTFKSSANEEKSGKSLLQEYAYASLTNNDDDYLGEDSAATVIKKSPTIQPL